MRKPKIMIVGHGRAGKDTACDYLALITTLRFAGTTSKYLCKHVAQALGVSEEKAYAERHQNRQFWKDHGDFVRRDDPTLLIRDALANSDITGGVRDRVELLAGKDQGLFDIIVWIDNNRVPPDPTVTFTERDCDIIIPNHWSLIEFYERLNRFATFAGLPLADRTLLTKAA